jgi:hypothetical protein
MRPKQQNWRGKPRLFFAPIVQGHYVFDLFAITTGTLPSPDFDQKSRIQILYTTLTYNYPLTTTGLSHLEFRE